MRPVDEMDVVVLRNLPLSPTPPLFGSFALLQQLSGRQLSARFEVELNFGRGAGRPTIVIALWGSLRMGTTRSMACRIVMPECSTPLPTLLGTRAMRRMMRLPPGQRFQLRNLPAWCCCRVLELLFFAARKVSLPMAETRVERWF